MQVITVMGGPVLTCPVTNSQVALQRMIKLAYNTISH